MFDAAVNEQSKVPKLRIVGPLRILGDFFSLEIFSFSRSKIKLSKSLDLFWLCMSSFSLQERKLCYRKDDRAIALYVAAWKFSRVPDIGATYWVGIICYTLMMTNTNSFFYWQTAVSRQKQVHP